MTKKEISFLAIANIAAIIFLGSLIYKSVLISLVAIFIYIGAVIFLAALPSTIWISVFFVGLWFMIDLVSSFSGLLFVFIFGLPTILLFVTVKKNFKLRIKIAFHESVTPGLNRFLLLSLLMFSFYLALNVSDETIKQSIKNMIPEKINVSGKEVDTSNSLDRILNEKVNDLINTTLQQKKAEMLYNCGDNQACKQTIENNFSVDYKQDFVDVLAGGSDSEQEKENNTENIVDTTFNELTKQTRMTAAQLVAVLLFLTLSPFTFLFSYILTILYGIIYSLLRMFRVLNLTMKQVDKEVLV